MAKTVPETALLQPCPLMVMAPTSGLEECAHQTLRWALVRALEGAVRLEDLRQRYVQYWNRRHFGEVPPKHLPTSGPYWEGPKMAIRTSRKIFDVVSRFRVLHPEQPYSLSIEGYTIEGQYSLVRRDTESGQTYVIVSHPHVPLHHASPDLLSLARALHASQAHDLKNLGVLHLPLLRGQIWRQSPVNIRLADEWIRAILKATGTEARYPVPGGHCLKCSTRPCMEVFSIV